MAGLLSEKFRKSIEESDFTDDRIAGLYGAVEGMSDDDFRSYMYTNRDYFKKNMPVAVDAIEGFQDFISVEPDYGVKSKINYEEITGSPDALSDEKIYSYDMKDFEEFGKKAHMSGRDFMKRMFEDKTKHDRYKIAHGEDEGGWFDSPKSFVKNLGGAAMNLLAPRTQEAIERGESPTVKDVLLDETQNILYAMPWGKVAGAATKIPKVGNVVSKAVKAGENVLTPLTTEILDAAAYDDEENPRGDFSWGDVGTGWLINRLAGKRIQPRLEKKLPNAAESVTPYLTNVAGDLLYGDKSFGSIPMMIPGVNMATKKIQDEMDKEEKLKERQKSREKAKNKYSGRYTRQLLEIPDETIRQWDAGFKPKAIEGDPLWEAYKQYMENK